jgi:hypothetical protein
MAFDFSEALSLIAVPFAAAGSAFAALKLLSRSEPLQLATLNWLTNRDPAVTFIDSTSFSGAFFTEARP